MYVVWAHENSIDFNFMILFIYKKVLQDRHVQLFSLMNET